MLAHGLDRARRLRHGRPGRLRRGRDRPRRMVRASPSASASTAWRRCATRSPTCAPSWRTTSASSRSSDLRTSPPRKTSVRAPLSWLRDFAPFPDDIGALRAALDDLGLVVEEVEHVGEGLGDVVVSRVTEISRHRGSRPDPAGRRRRRGGAARDRVRRAQLRGGRPGPAGSGRAPSCPGGIEIGRRKMRGVVSNGMLCSGTRARALRRRRGPACPRRRGRRASRARR